MLLYKHANFFKNKKGINKYLKGEKRMKKYILFFLMALLFLIGFFLTQDLWVGNIVREAIIKEVIPDRLSEELFIEWNGIFIIEKEKMGKKWECYFFALSSEESKEFFIATIFDPPEEIEDQINYLSVAEDISFDYLLKIAGLKESDDIKGFEIIRSETGSPPGYVAFLVLQLKNVRINKRPFKEYLKYL